MKKFFLELFLAFLLCAAAIYSGYLFFHTYNQPYNQQPNPLPLIASVILFIGSVFFLLKAGKTDMTFTAKAKEIVQNPDEKPTTVFEKNSELVNSWRKTESQKEQLRLLKLAGEMENG